MAKNVTVAVGNLPPLTEFVVREEVLVSLDRDAARVLVETIYNRITQLGSPAPKPVVHCEPARTWTFAGRHLTGNDGTVKIRLNDFLRCISSVIEGTIYSEYIGGAPRFTATAEADTPLIVTYTIDLQELAPPSGQAFIPQAFNVVITARSWNPDGSAAPDVAFGWIAVARVGQVTNF